MEILLIKKYFFKEEKIKKKFVWLGVEPWRLNVELLRDFGLKILF